MVTRTRQNVFRFGTFFGLLVLSFPLGADTIISDDVGYFGYLELGNGGATEFGWSQTGIIASDVSITAEIDPGGGTESIVAYLTQSIGPGTTQADQIASTNFIVTGAKFFPDDFTLFTGLTLDPGIYYLTLVGNGPGGVELPSAFPPPILASGVMFLGNGSGGGDAYPPANNFTLDEPFVYSVTGTVAVTTIPEPSLALLLACASLILFGFSFSRRRGWTRARSECSGFWL